MDFGSTIVLIEAHVPRVRCAVHGVHTAGVPWARPESWFTYAFEEQLTWLCVHACRSVVAQLMRVDWKTVGPVIARVYADLAANKRSLFDGLVNIGIDETSYKKGQKYVTVVVDHDRNRVVWVGKNHGKQVLEEFFSLLTTEQKDAIRCVTADGASWIAKCVEQHCPNAVRTLDPFHTVMWATEALDEVRLQIWRETRGDRLKDRSKRGGNRGLYAPGASAVKDSRFALLKNPENLTETQKVRLAFVAVHHPVLHRAYRMKEHLRLLLKLPLEEAEAELNRWLAWAQRCRIPVFVELGRKIRRHREAILDTIRIGLTNARIEAINNKIKVINRMGYGFRNLDNFIAVIMLRCGDIRPGLPGRAPRPA